jgi:hypothetical protein
MTEALHLEGKRFGQWTVLSRSGSVKYAHPSGKARCSFSMWLCVCDCGKKARVVGRSLTTGGSVCCGCRKRKTKYPEGIVLARVLSEYKSNARKRGIAFELTDRQLASLVSQPCHYTGRAPGIRRYRGVSMVCNGIDRVDPGKGYTVANCVPCCFEVNRAKSDMSEDEFLRLVSDVACHRELVT